MRIPHLTMCCCGCRLATGALIIGWLNLILSIIAIVFVILALLVTNASDGEYVFRDNVDTSVFLTAGTEFCLAILLLVGTNKRNDNYLNTWVIINSYVSCLYIVSYTANAILFMVAGVVIIGVVIIVFGSLSCMLNLYFICVVHNLRRQITNEKMNKVTIQGGQNLLSVA